MIENNTHPPAAEAPQPGKGHPPAMNTSALARGLVNLALVIWAVRDIRRRRDDEIKGSRKRWMLAAFAPPIGPIAYYLFGRQRGAQQDGSQQAR